VLGVGEKECGLTLHKELTVLAVKGANISLYCPTKEEVLIVSCRNAMGTTVPVRILFKGK
jgi:hypothetical protein